MVITGLMPMGWTALWLVFASRELSENWYHLSLAIGLITIAVGASLDPNDHSADVVYPMLPMIVALVMFPVARAWPYVIGAAIGSCAMVVFGDGPTPGLRVVVTLTVVMTLAVLLATGHNQLRRALERNRELSEIDGLTGIANVRRLTARLEDEFRRDRGTADFALLTIDLDDFKAVNDTLGHSTGDRVLVEVARAIESRLEPGDLVARRGGDEFTVIALPRAGRSFEQLREQLGEVIANTRRDLCPTIEPAASIGLVRRVAGETAEQLLARADASLHDQKVASHERRGGARSRVYVAVDEEDRSAGPGAGLLRREVGQEARPWAETYAEASWWMISGVLAVLAGVVPVIALVAPRSGLLTLPVFATCIASAVLATLSATTWRARPESTRRAVLGVALLLGIVLIAQAGEARNALADLLVLPSGLAFYVAGRRAGFVYASIGMGAYLYFLVTIGYDLSVLRWAQTSAVVMLMGYFVPRVTSQAEATAVENERLSGVDPLTGLANVRRMNRRLADELARVEAVGGYVTVFMIDLDDFKQVNDAYSHGVGDVTLVAVGEAIREHVRPFDLVARRGGDEFVVIVAHDGELDLNDVADRIEREIVRRRTLLCPDLEAGASVGWVTNRPGDGASELIARADASEHAVKQRHRNEPGLRIVA